MPIERWWGKFVLQEDTAGFWQIGPLQLWVSRSRYEWSLASEAGDDPMASALTSQVPLPGETPDEIPEAHRFGFRKTMQALHLIPVLADRPVVVSPETPFSLLPKEELTLFISSVLWIRIAVGDPPQELMEVATYRPSDTWFGPNTREGELCYAGKTGARHLLENLPLRPHRAISAVRIRNQAATNLRVERLKLPLPNMSLFADSDGKLWTESVTLLREEDGDLAALKLGERPPAVAKGCRLVSPPRARLAKGPLIQAFGGLFKVALKDLEDS